MLIVGVLDEDLHLFSNFQIGVEVVWPVVRVKSVIRIKTGKTYLRILVRGTCCRLYKDLSRLKSLMQEDLYSINSVKGGLVMIIKGNKD